MIEVRGVRAPRLGLGTWGLSGEQCTTIVREALAIGYRHFDTATSYENEAAIGNALQQARIERSDLFLVTKIAPSSENRQAVVRNVENSLQKLRVDYLDLVLVHWPPLTSSVTEVLDVLSELASHGKIATIGVSNFEPDAFLDVAEGYAISCHQIEYHPFIDQTASLKDAAAASSFVTAYCPLARGRVTIEPVIRDIATAHDKTPAQVALRWLLQQPRVAAIPKASNPAHLAQNWDVFDFDLDHREMCSLSQLAQQVKLVRDPRTL